MASEPTFDNDPTPRFPRRLAHPGLTLLLVALGCGKASPPPPPPPSPTAEKPPPTLADYTLKGKKLPAWVDELKEKDPGKRRQAAVALASVDASGSALVTPLVIETLRDENVDVRQLSAYVLGNLKGQREQTLPALGAALLDDDHAVRRAAAVSLVQQARGQPKALEPALKTAAASKDRDVQRLVAYVRKESNPASKQPVASVTVTPGKLPGPGSFGLPDSRVGKPAPKLDGRDLDGSPFNLEHHRGKIVLVMFWGDW